MNSNFFNHIIDLFNTREQENTELALAICEGTYPDFYRWFHKKVNIYLLKAYNNTLPAKDFHIMQSKYFGACIFKMRTSRWRRKRYIYVGGILFGYILRKEYFVFNTIQICTCGSRNFCSDSRDFLKIKPIDCKTITA